MGGILSASGGILRTSGGGGGGGFKSQWGNSKSVPVGFSEPVGGL